ncbi:sigma-70 family RNA polymerase sigma factor [Dyella choica]|uniref:sigma-70 family RNA polymerase sigma factor n=1 Tax=Dyella choica TaxID=1927959 RepID=UPI001E3ED6D6|nr:sigma-70 family RNA polymerase sigma factor [Dyella choica]
MKYTSQAFEKLAEPLRQELKRHCYSMLGSVHEAEDLVQETFLRAWRSFDGFEGRGSLRAWLYQIATNACLNALAARKNAQRLLPDQRAPASTRMPDGKPSTEITWLEPYPDSNLQGMVDDTPDPAARYASAEVVRLAFAAVIQQLPPRQRAALLLCDVVGWSAVETAALLGGSTASINSALQRARETLAKRFPQGLPPAAPATTSVQQALLHRYVQAWEGMDLASFVALLKEDAHYTMPPVSQWYAGRQAIGAFFEWAWKAYGSFRLIPTAANRQPAFAAYSRAGAQAPWMAHSIHVLTLEEDRIAALTLFVKPTGPQLFQAFGLPLTSTSL